MSINILMLLCIVCSLGVCACASNPEARGFGSAPSSSGANVTQEASQSNIDSTHSELESETR